MKRRTRISFGGDFGDTGKGEQNVRQLYELIEQLGIRAIEGYKAMLEADAWRVLSEQPVVLNCSPFGGGNAGNHNYLENGRLVKTHILTPGALLAPYVVSMLGQRKNIHIGKLNAEVETAKENGADIVYGVTLFIDRYATITTDQDIALDKVLAGALRGTFQGNAPAMAGRALRLDVRAGDLPHLDDTQVQQRIRQGIDVKNHILKGLGHQTLDQEELLATLYQWAQLIGENAVQDGYQMVHAVRKNPQGVLFINATQGQDLDGDTGTIGRNLAYGVSPGDMLKGSYVPLDAVDEREWVLIKKAYVTRAGAGLFPGEFDPEKAEVLRELGGEIGVTSGNKRRTGPDNMASTAHQLSLIGDGHTSVVITKADVYGKFMDQYGPQSAVIGFENAGRNAPQPTFPFDHAEPVWSEPYFWGEIGEDQRERMITEGWPAFPEGLQKYLILHATTTRAPVSAVGLGPRLGDTATKGLFEETVAFAD